MKICLVLLGFAAACASGGTPPRRATIFDDQLAPGLRAGSHEVVLSGARHYWRVAGPMRAEVPPVYLDEPDRFAREVSAFIFSR